MIPEIVLHHIEESAVLHGIRTHLAGAPHASLADLRRLDRRIAAHLDGIAVAGDAAWTAPETLDLSPGGLFAFTVAALQDDQWHRLERALALAGDSPELRRALLAAFGWVVRDRLRGTVSSLLRSEHPFRRMVGVATCSLHRVDPGVALRVQDQDAAVRARAFRTAGEIGKRELVSLCSRSLEDEDVSCQQWAAWSAVLLGDREDALDFLKAIGATPGPMRSRSLQLALLAMDVDAAHEALRQLAQDPADLRRLVGGAGLAGDPRYVSWLIARMADSALARAAGESFSMITGLDLAHPEFERAHPEDFEAGPNEDPDDPNVDMDPDEGLPWPDQGRVQAWWSANGARFAAGKRYFMGAPVTRSHCIEVLKNGYQRQRITAAYHLCLSHPGTQLFEWRAPAWRQRQELARLA